MIGAASGATSLKASDKLMVRKAVYCLSNVSADYTVDQVRSFVVSLGVRLISVFELPPAPRQPANNKSFRLCIIDEDKAKLTDNRNWTIGIVIRKWVRKPPNTLNQHQRDVAGKDGAGDMEIVSGDAHPQSSRGESSRHCSTTPALGSCDPGIQSAS